MFAGLLNACNSELLDINLKNNDIVGTAMMFKSNGTLSSQTGSLSLSCPSSVATLHAIKDDGTISSEVLASSPIDSSGNYKLSVSSSTLNFKSTQIRFVVKASGCGSEFCRPVTALKDQAVTGASTLVCMSSEIPGRRSLAEVSQEEIASALTSLGAVTGAAHLLELLNSVIANNSLATAYQNLTGVSAAKLKELPPSNISYTAPLTVHESAPHTYLVSPSHWNSDYDAAYEWKLDGVIVGSTATYVYSPGQNAQGNHQLVATVGSNNSGMIDTTKPTRSETFNLLVTNDYPAIAPMFALTSPIPSGLPISTRSVTLAINTGGSLNNCATFSKLALTENTSALPQASDFNIMCSSSGTQALAYNLASSGDGAKILRLWAMDSAGNISATASSVTIDLDTAAPTASITSSLASITNSNAQNITFTAHDNGGSIDHFECKLDSGVYTACSSPKIFSGLTQGSHTIAVRAIDTAGNTSADVTASWNVDLTEPTLSFSAKPNLVTNSLSSSFSFSGSDTGGGSIARYECKLDGGSYALCTSPKINVLTAGSHTLLVKAYDTAGNASDVLSYSWTIDTSGPTVSISSKPASLTNSQNASFSFSGTDTGGGTVASYECAVDSGPYASCVSPKAYPGLSAGSHTFAVRAIDTAGNTGTATTYNWSVDLSTPMASINSNPDSITNQTSASFTFSANPPPAGSITGYQCSLDGAAYTSCTSPESYSGLTQGSHTFGVKSVDNNSALSAAVTYTWTVDITNPVVTLYSGPSGVDNSTTASIEFSATDSGGALIDRFECKLDSASYAPCISPVNLSALDEGPHAYLVRAYDTAGNTSAVVSASWTTDLTPPSVTISASPTSITNVTSAAFSFSGTDTGGSSVASYQCSLDGVTFAACTSPKSYSGLAAGSHSFAVKAIDAVGNEGPAQIFSWTVDLTAPALTITSSPSVNSNSTSAIFSFSGSDTGGGSISGYECSVDSGSYASCSSPKSYTGLAQGAHTFNVRTSDTAGNISSVASFTWTVDTTAPTLTISTPSTDGGVIAASSIPNFTVSGACETGLNVVFSGASTSNTVCTSGAWTASLNLSSLSDGTLSLTATQTDAAGNSASRTRTFIKDTQGPTITLTSVPNTAQKGGSSVNIGFNVTEPNITTAQSFTFSYSSNNGATWTNASSSVTSTVGPLSSQAFNYSLTLPFVDSSQFKIKVTGMDAAGNTGSSAASGNFIVDSTAPSIASLVVNNGDSVALSATLTVKANATDSLSGVSALRFADAQSGNCQNAYANNNWRSFTNGGGVQSYSYLTGFVNGLKQICVWAKDSAGNVSQITANSNAGTEGVDMAKIRLDQGNPPIFTSLSVTNGNISSPQYGTTTFASSDTVTISFTVTDDTALATNPVEVHVTTDNTTYTQIATSTAVGSPGSGQTSWTKTYSSYLAPGPGFFRIRLIAKDANGNTTQMLSAPLNTGKWSLFAGNEDIGDGSSALAAMIRLDSVDGSRDKVVVNTRNEIFINTSEGVRKIDPLTGNITTYIKYGSYAGIPGTLSSSSLIRIPTADGWTMDGDMLYIATNGYVVRVNTITHEIIRYAGKSSTVNTSDPSLIYVWSQGAMTIDPDTKDLYFVNTCDVGYTGNSSTVSYKIQKITQNPTTKLAQSVVDVAGNCVKGAPIVEGNALATPLEPAANLTRTAHGSLVWVAPTQTLYFASYSARLMKIKNGNLYYAPSTIPIDTSARGGIYLPGKNKVYFSKGAVYSFTPTSSNSFDEVVSLEIKAEDSCVTNTCRDNGVSIDDAALTINSIFRIGEQIGFVENSTTTNTLARLMILDEATNTLQTIAGTDRFSGDGADRTLARFSMISRLVYKSNPSAGFPAGLYALDASSLRLLQMDPTSSTIHIRAGHGISASIAEAQQFGPSFPLGKISSTASDLRNIAVNPDNYFTFYNNRCLYNVKADATIEGYVYGGSTSIYTRADGYIGALGNRFGSGEHKAGLTYDAAGNLYMGGYQNPASSSESSGMAKIMVRRSNGSFYTVIGNSTVASSSDCATAGCAQAKSVMMASTSDSAGSVLLGAYDNRYNSNEGRLLFAEQSKIRFVSRAWDPTNSKYGTLQDSGGTAVDFGRNVGAFVYTYVDASSEQIDKIFYVSENKLYCYKVSAGGDSNCNNSALGPSTGLTDLASSAIALGPSGEIYVVNKNYNAIYKYVP